MAENLVVETGPELAYRPDIDGLRGIAILGVVWYHGFASSLPGGFVGVDVFFVISGYLISSIILGRLAMGQFSFSEFYARRIRRIFPALCALLIVVLGLGKLALLPDELRKLGMEAASASVFLCNFLFWRQAGYFDAAAQTKPLLHLWSLGVEEQFYLAWPAILAVAWRRRATGTVIVFVAAISLVACLWWTYSAPSAAFYLCFARFWELLLGAAVATRNRPSGRHADGVLSVCGLSMIFLSYLSFSEKTTFPGVAALMPTVGAVFCIAVGASNWSNKYILGSAPLVWVGLISYPLYLWHWVLISFTFIMTGGHPTKLMNSAAITLALVLAWATYKWIESPVRRGKPGRRGVIFLCIVLGLLGLAGINVAYGAELRPTTPSREVVIDQMKWSQTPSPGCETLKIRTPDCLITGPGPVISVLGDSHAMTLSAGLSRVLDPKIGIIYVGSGGCPPLSGVATAYRDEPSKCGPFIHARSQIEQIVGASKVTVLLSRGPLYLNPGTEWRLKADGRSGDNRKLFLDGYSGTIDILESLGKQAVLVVDAPDMGFLPSDCVDIRPVRLGSFAPRQPCAIALTKHAEDTRIYRAIVDQLHRSHPKLIVFDPQSLFCDANWCYMSLDGKMLYRDGDHLSRSGAEYVATELLKALSSDLRRQIGLRP